VYALILAGAQGIKGVKEDSGYKAGLNVGKRTMLGRVINAVAGLKEIEGLIMVGPEKLLAKEERSRLQHVVEPGVSFFDNLDRGMKKVPGEGKVLIVASDIPLITTEACRDFLRQCQKREADLYYPVIPKKEYERMFPGSRRTYAVLKDGTYTGGNMVLMSTEFFRRHRNLIRIALKLRKLPWILVVIRFGAGFWRAFARREVGIGDIERMMQDKYKVNGAAVVSSFPEMGFDVDNREDAAWIRFYWAGVMDGWKRREEPDEWFM